MDIRVERQGNIGLYVIVRDFVKDLSFWSSFSASHLPPYIWKSSRKCEAGLFGLGFMGVIVF